MIFQRKCVHHWRTCRILDSSGRTSILQVLEGVHCHLLEGVLATRREEILPKWFNGRRFPGLNYGHLQGTLGEYLSFLRLCVVGFYWRISLPQEFFNQDHGRKIARSFIAD